MTARTVGLSTSSVFPETTAAGVRARRQARLRRRRGDGRHRHHEPGPGRAAGARRTTTRSRSCRSTPRACSSRSGSGEPTRGASCSARRRPRSGSAPRPSWSIRRSGGSATTPASSSPGSSACARRPTSASPSRTCTPGGPVRARSRAYLPDWDVRNDDYPHTTLDLSHTAVSRTDAIEMAADLGDRLAHLHLADGTDSARDEHLIPGRGDQPVAEVLDPARRPSASRARSSRGEHPARARSGGAGGRTCAEALAFARLHLGRGPRLRPDRPPSLVTW